MTAVATRPVAVRIAAASTLRNKVDVREVGGAIS